MLRFGRVTDVHVCGPIGVGKTTLVKKLKESGSEGREETFPLALFEKYTQALGGDNQEELDFHATEFQFEMFSRAVTRTRVGGGKAGGNGKGGDENGPPLWVVERPWYENQVFAYANLRMNNLSERSYQAYRSKVNDFLKGNDKALREAASSGCVASFVLWTPLGVRKERIAQRARAGEDGYQDEYLDLLDHATFVLCLQSWLLHGSRQTYLPLIVPVDWARYGNAATIASRCVAQTPSLGGQQVVLPQDAILRVQLDPYFAVECPAARRKLREELMGIVSVHPFNQIRFVASKATKQTIFQYFDCCI